MYMYVCIYMYMYMYMYVTHIHTMYMYVTPTKTWTTPESSRAYAHSRTQVLVGSTVENVGVYSNAPGKLPCWHSGLALLVTAAACREQLVFRL